MENRQRTNSPPLIYQYDGVLTRCMDLLPDMMLYRLFWLVERSWLECQDLFTCKECEYE